MFAEEVIGLFIRDPLNLTSSAYIVETIFNLPVKTQSLSKQPVKTQGLIILASKFRASRSILPMHLKFFQHPSLACFEHELYNSVSLKNPEENEETYPLVI